ncbi:MAG: copper chaperone PCu(A)C [Actinomycetia bacterium]|nr:copper chaperone PCu(A)C [Actinomycetes bacterium]
MLKRLVIGLIALLFVPALLASCGSDDDGPAGPTLTGAWARSSPMVVDAGAAYFEVTSDEGDEIVGVAIDSSIAGTAELHETVMVDMDDDMDAEGEGDMDAEGEGDMEAEGEGDMDADGEGDMDADGEGEGDMDMDAEGDGEMDMGGAMTMQEVASIPVAAGETVAFQPGGLHVMMLGLVEPLEVGDEFDITLTFANAGDVVVTVEVREEAP